MAVRKGIRFFGQGFRGFADSLAVVRGEQVAGSGLLDQAMGSKSDPQPQAGREIFVRAYAGLRSKAQERDARTDSNQEMRPGPGQLDDAEKREDLLAKNWFITGASKGFGREWTEAALERGDKVAATARNPETLEALVDAYGDAVLPIQLDVTDRVADFEAVKKAANHLGKLDVVVNNAGYGHFGAIEELSEDDVRSQLEPNFFGALGDPGGVADYAGTSLS